MMAIKESPEVETGFTTVGRCDPEHIPMFSAFLETIHGNNDRLAQIDADLADLLVDIRGDVPERTEKGVNEAEPNGCLSRYKSALSDQSIFLTRIRTHLDELSGLF